MKYRIFTRGRLIVCSALVGALAITAMAGTAQAQDVRLDHFKCYGLLLNVLTNGTPPPVVTIADQFSEETVTVGRENRFCNPVVKEFDNTVTPILDEDHHLTFYKFDPDAASPQSISGEVRVVNQFGKQKFKFESANILAVPTQKQEGELGFPVGLSHFKCYFIAGALPKGVVAVGLEDQFETQKHKVLEPFLFCNPAEKTTENGVVSPIENPDAHLTCYKISLVYPYIDKSIVIANQFDNTKDLFPFRADLLCVPSEKEGFKLS